RAPGTSHAGRFAPGSLRSSAEFFRRPPRGAACLFSRCPRALLARPLPPNLALTPQAAMQFVQELRAHLCDKSCRSWTLPLGLAARDVLRTQARLPRSQGRVAVFFRQAERY